MTPTFRVIDKHTGREYSEENINTDGLMEMDLDQMFLGEDGTLVMADDCGRIAYQDCERFDVLIDGYVSIDRVLEIIDELKRMEDGLEERANSIGFVNRTPTGNVMRVEHLVMPRNPNEIKVVKLNAKADGIQYAREYLKSAVLALKGGEQ